MRHATNVHHTDLWAQLAYRVYNDHIACDVHMTHTVYADNDASTPRGFEPLRAEPNGFLVHLLSHSDTVSMRRGW